MFKRTLFHFCIWLTGGHLQSIYPTHQWCYKGQTSAKKLQSFPASTCSIDLTSSFLKFKPDTSERKPKYYYEREYISYPSNIQDTVTQWRYKVKPALRSCRALCHTCTCSTDLTSSSLKLKPDTSERKPNYYYEAETESWLIDQIIAVIEV